MAIIGLSGFAGTGKTTVAEYLVRRHGFVRLSFAAAVKDITAAAFGWERSKLEGVNPQDRVWRETPDPFWSSRMGRDFSPRTAMQYLGTDIFRAQVLPSIWCDNIIAKIRALPSETNIVIDDVRFTNERAALRLEGAQFLLLRPGQFPSDDHRVLWNTARNRNSLEVCTSRKHATHPSEWDWLQDATVADDPVIVNSGSYDDLYASVDTWYTTTFAEALLTTK